MKNILILCAFVLISTSSFGQIIPKGGLIGIHNFSLKLNGSTTEAEYLAAFQSKWIPVASKAYNCEIHVLKYLRGNSENKVGLLFIYKNAAERDKLYTADGKLNEAGQAAYAKVKPVDAELSKLGSTSGSFIDWGVQ
jgi:hypothetical protein